ncbi:hypothetical protein CERZMDRAFT_88267 [Cercospora zeae-maydis SCOH1-5]|uniref:GPI anchored protein n=1 Tax=Cercospora zeae-maydis SCOH1-5 TaxID=717836 RepID=A0A6A6F666_9PEZI|nr:hypothetical protein CERZMDRAFT_88267 [Cercospora zeae-maydis SCOH1-5]
MSSKVIAIALTLLPLALSQSTTTLQIPFYGYDNFAIDASILGVQNDLTTMTLACPTSASECGLFPTQILTYGASSYRMTMGADADFTGYQNCVVVQAVCTESAGGPGANFPGTSTTNYEDVETFGVVVTAGAEKLGESGRAMETGTMSVSASETADAASVTLVTGTGSVSGRQSASRTQSAAAETSSGAAAGVRFAQSGGVVGTILAIVALVL